MRTPKKTPIPTISLEESAEQILELTKELNKFTVDHHNKLEELFKLASHKTVEVFQMINDKKDYEAIDDAFSSLVLLLEVIKDYVPERLFYGLEQLIYQLTNEEACIQWESYILRVMNPLERLDLQSVIVSKLWKLSLSRNIIKNSNPIRRISNNNFK